jgi:hypothetical protein
MQRKLIVALVASALELYAASVSAQSFTCTQPFTTGPLNPVNGYAETVTDINGVSLQICKNADLCFFDPVVTGNLTSEQAGTGGESFWWLADAQLTAPSGLDAVLVMAAEATYTTEDPTPGEQLSFTRLRIRIDAPFTGVYTVDYPYGRESYRVEALAAGDEIREVFDISFTPDMLSNTPATGRVGPWLQWTDTAPLPPVGYIGDGATPHTVAGSPCAVPQNFFRITAVDLDGNPLPIGGVNAQGQAINFVQTDLFTVMGQKADGKFQTPLASERVSYARTAGGTQVDAFAVSGAATAVEMRDFVTTAGISTPVLGGAAALLQKETNGSNFSKSQALVNAPATLPAAMELHGSTVGGTSDATRLVRALTDSVVISQADYNPLTGKLLVKAASSDKVVNPALTIKEFGIATGTEIDVGGVPPATVTVLSAAGGSDTVKVRVTLPQAVIAPNGVTASLLASPTRVQVSWTDRSDNETGFEVVRTLAGVATVVGTPNASNGVDNPLTFDDSTVSDDLIYTYSVRSVLGGQKTSSAASNSVLVPINAPVLDSVTPAVGNTSTNLVLSWATSAKAVSYNIYRDNALIRNVTGSTYTDVGLQASTTYSYRVEAVGANSSTMSNSLAGSTSAASLLNAPTNLAVVTGTSATRPRVTWGDASQGETGYRLTRSAVNVTTLAAGATTTINLAANATSHTLTAAQALTTQTLYQFTVQALGATNGPTTSVYHYVGNLPGPRTLRATVVNRGALPSRTPVGQVPVTWLIPNTAGNANVLGYEVQYCVGTANTCNTSGAWTGQVVNTGRTSVNQIYTGLTSGRLHTFRVRSTTAAGIASAWSTVSATPR